MSDKTHKVEENWDAYLLSISDKPGVIRLNMKLKDVAPIAGYTHRMRIIVTMLQPNEHGFPSREEGSVLEKIEEAFRNELLPLGAVFAGTAKSDGEALWYFYPADIDKSRLVVDAVMKAYKEYIYDINVLEDAEWGAYFDFLYPSIYELRGMNNRKLIEVLTEHGDIEEREREVEHWFYFVNEANANNCAKDLEEMGCKIENIEKRDDLQNDKFPYQVRISLAHNTEYHNVNSITWDFISLSEKYGGIYDGWETAVVTK